MDTPNEIDNAYLVRLYLRLNAGFDAQIKLCILENQHLYECAQTLGLIIHENYEERISQIFIYLNALIFKQIYRD